MHVQMVVYNLYYAAPLVYETLQGKCNSSNFGNWPTKVLKVSSTMETRQVKLALYFFNLIFTLWQFPRKTSIYIYIIYIWMWIHSLLFVSRVLYLSLCPTWPPRHHTRNMPTWTYSWYQQDRHHLIQTTLGDLLTLFIVSSLTIKDLLNQVRPTSWHRCIYI